MTRTTYKKIPFDLELAKKITNKEVKGRIVTEDNLTARIVCFDMKFGVDKILAVLVDCGGEYEIGVRCNLDGTCRDDRKEDKFNLHIEVPTYYRDYSNFVPQRWQTCLVRDYSLDIWRVAVCSGKDAYGRPLFYSERNTDGCCGWYHYLPLSKVTERLIGISKSYEELIKELDAESTATTKKRATMTRTTFKKIPFDIELAKKITNKEAKGRIVTQEGKKVRIICWDKKPVDEEAHEYPIVAIIQNDYNGEMLQTFTAEGAACYPNYKSRYDLIIEIPTYYRDYSNFVPQKWQPCLVRDNENHLWGIQVYSHTDCQGKMLFYNDEGYVIPYTKVLPLSKVTARLIGTTKSYEQLIEELDKNGKD